ncbi:zinc-binding dehydrogenase [Natronoglycomyces albus]|uniref:Zinc-binding dehydrogenase n=1 Tax=Natronoglycomyces albus TaxID=2811108 RepID=A0A895XPU0_9ACTN|nr:zinc-binding dehydrogenase [Natronoglycomyces albus]QSB05389.1 zinc-binding dehydrogenase [Natronoglycomyces albus]
MRAIMQYAYGGPETLLMEEQPDLSPAQGQVRIKVAASGVHLIDTVLRSGDTDALPYAPPALPMTPGREVAGTVDAVGDGVDSSWVGQRVVTHLGLASGGYAEQAIREVGAVHVLPAGVDEAAAVAAIGTGRTALSILEHARPTAEDLVLVTAAAGGIGTLLVQYLKRHVGAEVVGVAGGREKVSWLRGQGVDHAVDYTSHDWAEQVRKLTGGRDITLVFDGVGGESGRVALELLGLGGRHVMFGWSAGSATQLNEQDIMNRGLTVSSALGPHVIAKAGGMRELETQALRLVEKEVWTPQVHRFALEDAAAAHRALVERSTVGKVILSP